jgi:hypothetical protein
MPFPIFAGSVAQEISATAFFADAVCQVARFSRRAGSGHASSGDDPSATIPVARLPEGFVGKLLRASLQIHDEVFHQCPESPVRHQNCIDEAVFLSISRAERPTNRKIIMNRSVVTNSEQTRALMVRLRPD